MALDVATDLFNKSGSFQVVDSLPVTMEAIQQISKAKKEVQLSGWYLGDTPLHNNFTLVDEIMDLTGQTATVFQKIPGGYLRISTNVRKLDGSRAVGTYIPDSSPVIQTIERGETFYGRAYVVNDWYLTAYQPIKSNGNTVGILYVGVKEKDLNFLKEKFYNKTYATTGYPYALSSNGNLLIHPEYEDETVEDHPELQKLLNLEEGDITMNWGGEEGETFIHYLKSYEAFDLYIGIAAPKEYLINEPLSNLQNLILFVTAIFGVLAFVVLRIYLKKEINPLIFINERLKDIAGRKKVDEYQTNRTDEIGQINQSLNRVVSSVSEVTRFAEEMGKKNFDYPFQLVSEEDSMGKALLQMKEDFVRLEEEEKTRNWQVEGIAGFNDLFRQTQDNLANFGSVFLGKLIPFVHANQGRLYLVQEGEEDQPACLELVACYAWGRKKFIEERIEEGEGLTGQCWLEKKPVIITEVPHDYANIKSGTGEVNPGFVIIIPLMDNDECIGILEIAAIREMEEHMISFLNKLAESLSSVLANINNTHKMETMLQKSREQAEELRAQEEEMRQNMEEMQATQEQLKRVMEEKNAEETQN
jgi:hypothetical protein